MVRFPISEIIALIDSRRQVSYSELEAAVTERESFFSNTEAISILSAENTIEFVVDFLASARVGRAIAILSPEWTEAERNVRLEMLKETDALHPECVLIVFTSGSTGSPKAVQLSLANIEANTRAVIHALNFSEATEQTLFLPLHYSFGLLGQLLPALHSGMTTRLLKSFAEVPKLISENKIGTLWSGVPTHWQALLRIFNDRALCEKISHVISAGAPLSFELRRELAKKFPNAVIYNNYGLTEMSPRVLSFSSRYPNFFDSGVGFPVQGITAKLSSTGELCLEGPQMMLGYLGDDTATRERIQNDGLHTGDFAEIAVDGLISILGRKDDLFKLAGERVSIHEIEEAVRKTRYFKEVAIFLEDDALYGVRINAFVVWAGLERLNRKELRNQISSFISLHKTPARFFVVDRLPKSESGKVLRVKFKEVLSLADELF